jgi:hypothetical protein
MVLQNCSLTCTLFLNNRKKFIVGCLCRRFSCSKKVVLKNQKVNLCVLKKEKKNRCILPPLRNCGRVSFIDHTRVWVEGLVGVKIGERVSFGYPSQHNIPLGDNLGVVTATKSGGA